MGHKALIGGTAYEITGGKTLVDGTAYDIASGKTLVEGTAYEISFARTLEQTLPALMARAVSVYKTGRVASSSAKISIAKANIPVGISYLLSFCNGYMSIYKVTRADSSSSAALSRLKYMSTSYGNAVVDSSGTIYYSNNGSSQTSVYAGHLALMTFSGYTEQEIDAIFAAARFTRKAGRNASSKSSVSANVSQSMYVFTAYSNWWSFCYYDHANNTVTVLHDSSYTAGASPSLLYNSGTALAISTNGESATSIYGGSIVQAA